MIRKFLLTALFIFVLSLLPAMAIDLEPIPNGADIVILVNNHSGLPLGDVLTAAPIPPMLKGKLDEFFTATSFNPLKDVSRVQLMVKKGATKRDDNAVAVLSGTFNKAKIMDFIKGKFGQGIEEENLGNLTLYSSKDGKGGLCFLDNSKVALGTLAAVKVFLEAKAGTDISKNFDSLKDLLTDKTYAAVMVGGKEFLQKEMQKSSEKREARREKRQRPQNPIGKMLESYLTEGVAPQGIFVQLLESKLEAKVFYDRSGSKSNFIHASIEIGDPKITVEKLFAELLKVLPELPAPEKKRKKTEKKNSDSKW